MVTTLRDDAREIDSYLTDDRARRVGPDPRKQIAQLEREQAEIGHSMARARMIETLRARIAASGPESEPTPPGWQRHANVVAAIHALQVAQAEIGFARWRQDAIDRLTAERTEFERVNAPKRSKVRRSPYAPPLTR